MTPKVEERKSVRRGRGKREEPQRKRVMGEGGKGIKERKIWKSLRW